MNIHIISVPNMDHQSKCKRQLTHIATMTTLLLTTVISLFHAKLLSHALIHNILVQEVVTQLIKDNDDGPNSTIGCPQRSPYPQLNFEAASPIA